MRDEAALWILVFAEDRLGVVLARDLSDRVVVERGPSWLADLWGNREIRESQRRWSGLERSEDWTSWVEAKELGRQRRLSVHALGMKGYASVAYRAAHLAAIQEHTPGLVVFCIDTDGSATVREELLDGLRKARVESLRFVLAVAHQECESWVLAGFVPDSAHERRLVESLEAEHGFDPTAEPHRMTPKNLSDPHDAKRICQQVFADSSTHRVPRAQSCWLDTPLAELERRGSATGLPEYLANMRDAILPQVAGSRPDGS